MELVRNDLQGNMIPGYSMGDVTKILSATRSTIQQWLTSGFVFPSLRQAKKRGTRNLFSVGDLYQIKFFQRLAERGFNRTEAARISQGANTEALRLKESAFCAILCKYHKKGHVEFILPPRFYEVGTLPTVLSTMHAMRGEFDDVLIFDLKPVYDYVDSKIAQTVL